MDHPEYTSRRKEHPKAHNLLQSFRFAISGIARTLVTQRNMKIHVLAALFVLLLGMISPFNYLTKAVVLLCIALVLFSEVMNTAMEAIVDLYTGETHRLAQIAKDAAAGGVMVLSLSSVFIFLGILWAYQADISNLPNLPEKMFLIAAIVTIQAFCLAMNPSTWIVVAAQGLSVAFLFLIVLQTREPIFGTAAFLLIALIAFAPAIFKHDEAR